MKFNFLIILLLSSLSLNAQINIWEGTDCKKNVELIPYLVEGKNNPAVIVCPGGSYFWHDLKAEGEEVGKWLQNNGISAFVLRYRTAYVPAFIFHFRYIFRGNRYPDPQNDLKQTLFLLRTKCEEFGIDSNKIGAMGFSAGGHLVMSSVELFEKEVWPNFIVSIYPVVTMEGEYTHKRSRRGLLGDNKQKNYELRNSLSLEKNLPDDCPPVFLVNCKDDPIVDYQNSLLLDSALTAKHIPHEYYLYETGGHGFGASTTKGSEECRQWKDKFISWVNNIINQD